MPKHTIKCCNVMKKEPAHRYEKETGRKAILGQMADESRLRTQQWLKNGCNGGCYWCGKFDKKGDNVDGR